MSDLTDFLLARIAEDEYDAKAFVNELGHAAKWRADDVGGVVRKVGQRAFGLPDDMCTADTHMTAAHIARHDPARALAECEAKRRMMEYVLDAADAIEGEWGCGHSREEIQSGMEDGRRWSDGVPRPIGGGCHGVDEYRRGLSILAAVYADHEDYRQEWRP